MAYREVGMVAVREMLRRWQAGDGFRALARAVGVDRATVAEYIRGAMTAGVAREGPAASDAQIAAILAARRPGRPGALETPSAEWAALGSQQDTIRRWLADDGLRLTKVHRRLTAQGVTVSYSTLYRFARRHCGFTPGAVTVRVAEPPPGELAEIDFGMLGWWVDPTTTRRRRIDGLLVTLAASRYAFLWIALRQDLATVLDGLEAAWAFFGGVPRRLVVDNLRAVVAGADRYRPTLAPVFLEYAQYRGFVVDPAYRGMRRANPKSSGASRTSARTSSAARRFATSPTCRHAPSAGVATSPACGSTARPGRCRGSCSRPRSRRRCCPWPRRPSTARPGRTAPCIRITMSSSAGRSTPCPPAISDSGSRCAAIASSCASRCLTLGPRSRAA